MTLFREFNRELGIHTVSNGPFTGNGKNGYVAIYSDGKFWELPNQEKIEFLVEAQKHAVLTSKIEQVEYYLYQASGNIYHARRALHMLEKEKLISWDEFLSLVGHADGDYREAIARIIQAKEDSFKKINKRSAKQSLKSIILDRDDYKCRYCGVKVEKKDPVDHVIPYSLGGKTDESNLVACCKACNSKKSGRTPEQAGMKLFGGLE